LAIPQRAYNCFPLLIRLASSSTFLALGFIFGGSRESCRSRGISKIRGHQPDRI